MSKAYIITFINLSDCFLRDSSLETTTLHRNTQSDSIQSPYNNIDISRIEFCKNVQNPNLGNGKPRDAIKTNQPDKVF